MYSDTIKQHPPPPRSFTEDGERKVVGHQRPGRCRHEQTSLSTKLRVQKVGQCSDAWRQAARWVRINFSIHGTRRSRETKVCRLGFHQSMGALPLQSNAKVNWNPTKHDKRLLYIAMASTGSDECQKQCKAIEKVWIKFELNHFPKWAQLFVMGWHPIGHTFRQA